MFRWVRGAIYIPKHIADELRIEVVYKLIHGVRDGKIILTNVKGLGRMFSGESTLEEGEEITNGLIGSG